MREGREGGGGSACCCCCCCCCRDCCCCRGASTSLAATVRSEEDFLQQAGFPLRIAIWQYLLVLYYVHCMSLKYECISRNGAKRRCLLPLLLLAPLMILGSFTSFGQAFKVMLALALGGAQPAPGCPNTLDSLRILAKRLLFWGARRAGRSPRLAPM